MSDTTGNTASSSSSLAITENRASHRPGERVGIVFQLFDWNRIFAKKKLFSRKLLPPARSKQASKRVRGEEKMPKTKIHLIADENSGGFPNVVKRNGSYSVDTAEQKHEMRATGLVARLMGLESVPAVPNRDNKQKKGSNPSACNSREERFSSSYDGSDREDLNLFKGSTKIESRPQKLQKTGQCERRAVTGFGPEALQIKGVLSRSQKPHHPKLSSPVKSPRLSLSRNSTRSSRLIDAATRILEPGLQATNRAKYALAYSSSVNYPLKNVGSTEVFQAGVMLPDVVKQEQNDASYEAGLPDSSMRQASCKNCGNLVGVMDPGPPVQQQPFVCLSPCSNVVNEYSQGCEMFRPRQSVSSIEQEREVVYQRVSDQIPTAGDEQHSPQIHIKSIVNKKPLAQEAQARWQLRRQQRAAFKDKTFFISHKQMIQIQDEKSVGSNRVTPRERMTILQAGNASAAVDAHSRTKDFFTLNKSLSGRSRPRVFSRVDDSPLALENKFCSRQDGSMSNVKAPVRKRRTANSQIASGGFITRTAGRERHIKRDSVNGNEMRLNTFSEECPKIKTRSTGTVESNITNSSKVNDVISFTFNIPLRHKTNYLPDLQDRMVQVDKSSPHCRNLGMDETDSKTSMQRRSPLIGDALGALLEQKLRELDSQEADELTIEGNHKKKSTSAAILQELIAALASEQPVSASSHTFNSYISSQEGISGGAKIGFSNNGDHLSPGSVLEASFSNDSCLSSSFDDNSGRRLLSDYLEHSYDWQPLMEAESILTDSATFLHDGHTSCKMVTVLLNHLTKVLHSINVASGGLLSDKLSNAKDIIMNAELLFENTTLSMSDSAISSLLGLFVVDELDAFADAIWTNINSLLGFDESKDSNQLKRFLFDCVVECLELKYGYYGFKTCRRVLPRTDAAKLIQEIVEEVRKWVMLAGMVPDEIINWEMDHSLGKWTDFDIEAFENGVNIEKDILQLLVEEVVIDLWECMSSY